MKSFQPKWSPTMKVGRYTATRRRRGVRKSYKRYLLKLRERAYRRSARREEW